MAQVRQHAAEQRSDIEPWLLFNLASSLQGTIRDGWVEVRQRLSLQGSSRAYIKHAPSRARARRSSSVSSRQGALSAALGAAEETEAPPAFISACKESA